MKKTLLSAVFFLSLIPAACADLWAVRGYLELMGQYNLIFNARDVMSVPAAGNTDRLVFLPSLVFNGVFMFGGDDGLFAVYIKKDHIALDQTSTVIFNSSAESSILAEEQWGMHYVGLGGRKYFFTENWNMLQLMPYAGIDLGAYFTSNTVSKITIRDEFGSPLASGEMEASGGFFGANVEAGADFWIMNEFAIIAKLGYRFCGGTVKSAKTSEILPFSGTLADVYEVTTDYSGFYIQLGVTFNFQRYD